MSRPARALIDLEALRHNYRIARRLHGGRALAVVKANAYGHGAVACAGALEAEADGFAVAAIEEAVQLRDAGIRAPILLLEGIFTSDELLQVQQHRLWIVVHAQWQIDALLATTLVEPLTVWLKMDTGMHRVGIAPDAYLSAWTRLQESGKVRELVSMTHLASADEPQRDQTLRQLDLFDSLTKALDAPSSLCNSAGLLGWPPARRGEGGWARPGIMLYGSNPMPLGTSLAEDMRPVMTLESSLIAVRELAAGEAIGYGGSFVTQQPTRVGVAALGYADGYPRAAVSGTPVAVEGLRTRLIGRVSMDMVTVDISDIPMADVGSIVEFWGRTISVDEVARCACTIAYEILCNVKRARFEYRNV